MQEDEVPPSVSLLTVQFLTWLADRPRTYADVMEAWRSTCRGFRCGRIPSAQAWYAMKVEAGGR